MRRPRGGGTSWTRGLRNSSTRSARQSRRPSTPRPGHPPAAGRPPASALAGVFAHSHPGVRRAVVQAIKGREGEEILALVRKAAEDDSNEVRAALGASIHATPSWRVDDVVTRLLGDGDESVRMAAVEAAGTRPALFAAVLERLREDVDWTVREIAVKALASADPRTALLPLVSAVALDDDRDVSLAAARAIEKHLATLNGWPDDVPRVAADVLGRIPDRLEKLGPPRFPKFSAWLAERTKVDLDTGKLEAIGEDLTRRSEEGRLPRAHAADEVCDAIVRVLRGKAPRATVLIGPAGSGKTAAIHEVVHRLRSDPDGPWRVVRVSPADLLAGTRFLGEWQTK